MVVRILPSESSTPAGKIADAEIVFEEPEGVLAGLKLVARDEDSLNGLYVRIDRDVPIELRDGSIFRIGVGATPFLLPLLFQLGFGMTPFASGMLTFASAAGAMTMKFTAQPILKRFGFRTVLIVNGVLSSAFIAAYGLFTPATPHALIIGLLLMGGFFRSLEFTSINAIAYADVPNGRMSQATSFVSAAQQIALSIGVAAAALILETVRAGRGDAVVTVADFTPAFVIVALASAACVLVFARLPRDAAAELSGRAVAEADAVPATPATTS